MKQIYLCSYSTISIGFNDKCKEVATRFYPETEEYAADTRCNKHAFNSTAGTESKFVQDGFFLECTEEEFVCSIVLNG